MASPTESTYGDIQMNERYKRLKRNLKMTLMKEAERRNADNGISDNPGWQNVSSINGDNLDTSLAAVSLYSKNGSEVVSSSTNMKNVLSHQNTKKFSSSSNNNNNNINSNNKDNIATSSVKQFPLTNDAASRALMPPPKSIGILAHSSRRNSPAGGVNPLINMRSGNAGNEHDDGVLSPSIYSSIKCPSSVNVQDTSQVIFEKIARHDEMRSNLALTEKPDRIFSKWRVILNDKGQLIIKGTLECGKVARSKPVIRRLTAISVQSIFNHIYNLNGNIYDERNELPDYIRGKFFNGFPDDWENVYQVWRNFVAEGSSINFRWPTPITDSDDDLKSEITEITSPRRNEKRPGLRSDSLRDRNRPRVFSHSTVTDRTLTNEEAFNYTQCQCTATNSIRDESINLSRNEPRIVNDECCGSINTSTVNRIQRGALSTSNTNITPYKPSVNVTSLKDVLPEDKINIILEHLNSKSCSIEYIDKIIQMYDCFRYIMSYKSESDIGTESVKSTHTASNIKSPETDCISQTNLDATFTKLRDTNTSISRLSTNRSEKNRNPSKRDANITSNSSCKQSIRRRLSRNDYDSSDSYENDENDSDYGRPNRSSRRILRSHDKRSVCRKASFIEKKSSRRRMGRSDDSEDDDYVPKTINPLPTFTGAGLHNAMRNTTPTVTPQTTDIIHHTNEPRDAIVHTRSTSHRLQQRSMKPYANHRHDRASSMSTIGGFLKNYDSSVSITEDESKVHDDKNIKLKSNDNCGGNEIERRTHVTNQSNLRNAHQYYDSSVSITEDEFSEANRGKHDTRKQVLQEFNTQCLQQVMKRRTIGLKHLSTPPNPFSGRNLPKSLSKISEIDEVSHREMSHNQHNDNEPILNDNKENQSMDAGENRNDKNPSEVNEEIISEKSVSKSVSPVKKKKLTIVKIENPSINLKPETMTKPQSHKLPNPRLDSPKKDEMALDAIETLRPSKSLDDRKRTGNTPEEFALITEQLKATPKSKSLTVQLQYINDMTKDKQAADSKSEKINKEPGVFGSENNPKRLTAWVPRVLQKPDSDHGLIFEGKLLNEADHVVNRKFATDFISARISLKVVKTESNEFYQLVGDLTDTKHTMPKELQKLCFNGCPSKIPQFCEKWKKLILDNSNSSGQLLNISKDIQNMPVSSRGRRILPPLCYWQGERVTLRDNQVVYNPGNSQDSSILSAEISQRDDTHNSSKRRDTSAKDTTVSTKKNSSAHVESKEQISNETLQRMTSNQESRTRVSRNSGDMEHQRRGRQATSVKRTLSRHLSPHSSDSMDTEEPSNPKRRRSRIDNSMVYLENENTRSRTQRERRLKGSTQASNVRSIDLTSEKNHKYMSSGGQNDKINQNKLPDARGVITYKYKKRINRESELSEDQVSAF